MKKYLEFYYKRLIEKLWFKPLIFCLLSISGALIADLGDNSFLAERLPQIEKKSVEQLLTTISSTMLVIAIFSVGAMLSAFSSATGTATPRSFALIVADDVSQNALSVFIGSFIYSIVATVALQNNFYSEGGYFILFILTLTVFSIVIITFLRWVEQISKLGRLGHTIKKVEEATKKALTERKKFPTMGGVPLTNGIIKGEPVYSQKSGYVQFINMNKLQKWAEEHEVRLAINCLPGAYAALDKPLAYIIDGNMDKFKNDVYPFEKFFFIDDNRSFHGDPRFGLIALSEIASRALSPGINDPGTAIAILNSHVRLFCLWFQKSKIELKNEIQYDRLEVPEILVSDLFNDAFMPIARDGANNLEVMIRLQKALKTISNIGYPESKQFAEHHSRLAFERAKIAMDFEGDTEILKKECLFTTNQITG